jgi:hypothetical protein
MTRTFGVVTSFSEAGWAEYGSKMIASFLEYFPTGMKLHVYVDFKLKLKGDRLIVRSIHECCPELLNFLHRNDIFDFSRGNQVLRDGGIKVFTSEHAVLNANEDVMIWLDADCIASDHVPPSLLELMIPETCMIGGPGRWLKYPRSEYIAYNLHHPSARLFISTVADMYRSGAIYSLKAWHDRHVFDVVRAEFQTALGMEAYDISGETSAPEAVFASSELGRYLAHPEGARLGEGRSFET